MKRAFLIFLVTITSILSVKTMDISPNGSMTDYAGKLFIVYGPSGSGKTTLVTEAILKISKAFPVSHVITYTCRAPRPFEVHGKDYYFITQEEFTAKQAAGYFIDTNDYCNKPYGCPRSLLGDLKSGKNLIVILDRSGAKNISQIIKNTILIWVAAPLKELEKRLNQRNSENQEQVARRLAQAKKEIDEEEIYRMHHHCIINDDFTLSLQQMISLITNELGNQSLHLIESSNVISVSNH